MSSIGFIDPWPAIFGTDADAGAFSENTPLCMDDPLGLDPNDILSFPFPWDSNAGTQWNCLNLQHHSPPAETQQSQQKDDKPKKQGDTKKEPQTQVGLGPSHRRRSTAKTDLQTKLSNRQKTLESNRLAASRCRQKKKGRVQHLETLFREQSLRKQQLEDDIIALRGEILGLKDEILKHAPCEDGRIGRHMAHVMQQITQGNTANAGADNMLVDGTGD